MQNRPTVATLCEPHGRYRVGVLATHPIQYHAPFYRALATRDDLDLEVFFCHRATPSQQAAAGFGVEFDWDVPLLEGYSYRFLNDKGSCTPGIATIIQPGRYTGFLVNGWTYKTAWQAIRACWATRTPVLIRGDSHLNQPRPLFRRLAKYALYRTLISRSDACLAVGTWSKKYYVHYGARPERIFLVPHTANDAWFMEEAAAIRLQRSEIRRRWDLDESATVFLFAGKFLKSKRPMDFIQAIAEARDGSPSTMGLMVGDGPVLSACKDFVSSSNLPVRFAGFLNQSEMPRAYAVADALVLPSRETWGIVVNEAMACGVPAFVSDQVGAAPDLIVGGETGDVFPFGGCRELAALLRFYSGKTELLRSMGQHARRRLESHSLEAAIAGTMDALRAVCARRR